MRLHLNPGDVLSQFRLGPANIGIQELANAAQSLSVTNSRMLVTWAETEPISLVSNWRAIACNSCSRSLIASTRAGERPARSHGTDQVSKLPLDLLRSLAHAARLARQLTDNEAVSWRSKFLEGVIDGVGLNERPLEVPESSRSSSQSARLL